MGTASNGNIQRAIHFADDNIIKEHSKNDWSEYSILSILRWSCASMEKLIDAEQKLLSRVRYHITSRFINVRLCSSSIYTVTVKRSAEEPDHPIPFVLIHGFAAGLAIWCTNLDALAGKRTVHAFDILGFAHSSRPTFSSDATIAEFEFVQSIEDWRRAMNIEKMILVGHSFGGYLASSYSLEFPERVRHLVLVDPWGFPDKPPLEQSHIPVWMRAFGLILSRFNPLAAVRIAGPFAVRYGFDDPQVIYDYIYQCNANNPTGEMAFVTMTKSFGWAKRPMIHRFCGMHSKLPVTFICGSKSWIDSSVLYEIQSRRSESYVDVQVITGAGHHVYVDANDAFNALMGSISNIVETNEDLAAQEADPDGPDAVRLPIAKRGSRCGAMLSGHNSSGQNLVDGSDASFSSASFSLGPTSEHISKDYQPQVPLEAAAAVDNAAVLVEGGAELGGAITSPGTPTSATTTYSTTTTTDGVDGATKCTRGDGCVVSHSAKSLSQVKFN